MYSDISIVLGLPPHVVFRVTDIEKVRVRCRAPFFFSTVYRALVVKSHNIVSFYNHVYT
jgi:hypothetical protein